MHACEIKRGCVSMLATLECIPPELTGKFPGYLAFFAWHQVRRHSEWPRGQVQSPRLWPVADPR
eukprot:10698164-Lingulodinium_polyedra.AAC.1